MDPGRLTTLLESVADGRLTPPQALARLRHMPYEDLSFARLDHHRALRQGFPEVIYCEGKTDSQVLAIVSRMLKAKQPILATRANESLARKVGRLARRARYHPLSRCIVVPTARKTKSIGGILVLSAGTSDIPVAEEAAVTAETLGSKVKTLYDVGVAGLHRLLAHRAPQRVAQLQAVRDQQRRKVGRDLGQRRSFRQAFARHRRISRQAPHR
ncbi:MAG: hypothetical protein HYR98_10270, partial [Nitrospirae bacterium]|nr:hypothetical protein [Nitrospirota bacterium]